MSKANTIDENLLAKYLEGEATKVEQAAMEAWLQEDTANLLELDRYRKLWELKPETAQNFEPDANLAWQKVKERINVQKQPKSTFQHVFSRNFSIAASIALAVSFGVYFYFFKEKPLVYKTVISKNNSMEQLLMDSSKVFLNHNSNLEYPTIFAKNERRVKLKGEAFFDIKPNPQKPFLIEVQNLQIKVLGTSFNVKEDSLSVSVLVRSGKVEVAKINAEKEILLIGDLLIYDKSKRTFTKSSNADANEFAYYSKVFSFKNTSLAQVSQILSRGYHANITVGNEELNQLAITTKFENESLGNALQIIAETLQLKLKVENNSYVFVKK